MNCDWQHVMECYDPIAFSIGSFSIYWYALFFLLAWVVCLKTFLFFEKSYAQKLTREQGEDLFWWLLFGAFVGARIGYALFYAPGYFFSHPLELFIPYNFSTGVWSTLRGMSFHGGLLGVMLTLIVWSRKNKQDLFVVADHIALVAPLISLFGRIGNFLNQELPGKITTLPWGTVFPGESVLRHPVTLYSAVFEGLFLFVWLLWWRKRLKRKGDMTILYLFSYGLVRMIVEVWREPDPGVALLFDLFSRGQILSFFLIITTGIIWFLRSKYAIIEST